MKKYIDLSHTISQGMPVYPGDAPTVVTPSTTIGSDGFNSLVFSMCNHSGTHIDLPLHMLAEGKKVDSYPPERFCGRGVVLDVRGMDIIDHQEWMDEKVKGAEVVLFYTCHDDKWEGDDYFSSHPVLDLSIARFLAEENISLVGMDTPSPDMDNYQVHRYLFEHGIFIVENLCNLGALTYYKSFDFFAFPLKIAADAAPVRVVAVTDK
jgi:kynurenine formamidase